MRISKIVTAAVVALTFGAWAQTAQAAPTITTLPGWYAQYPGNVDVYSLDSFVTFDVNFGEALYANNTVITNQFASSGVTFSPLANGAVRYNSCGNNAWGWTTNLQHGVVDTLSSSCAVNNTDDSFSLSFNGVVEFAAFGIWSNTYGPGAAIQALLNGVVVASLTYTNLQYSYVLVSQGLFDELRFLEGSNPNTYVVMDALGFNYAEVSGVPAPGALALLGLGLLGIAGLRRRRAA